MSFVKRPKSSPKKTRPTFIEPLILEKRPNNLFDTMREYNMRPAYSPPKIRPLNKEYNKSLKLNNVESREKVREEVEKNKEICIKFYNESDFIEEIIIKNGNIENNENLYSIGTWERDNNYIWDSTDDKVEMEGWLVNNLMRFEYCIMCLELPRDIY
jgi:hypothetical protein